MDWDQVVSDYSCFLWWVLGCYRSRSTVVPFDRSEVPIPIHLKGLLWQYKMSNSIRDLWCSRFIRTRGLWILVQELEDESITKLPLVLGATRNSTVLLYCTFPFTPVRRLPFPFSYPVRIIPLSSAFRFRVILYVGRSLCFPSVCYKVFM